MLLPVMRPKSNRATSLIEISMNVHNARDPDARSKLLGITCACVVCDAPMHPMQSNGSTYGISINFTCGQQSCADNISVIAAIAELQSTLINTCSPAQTLVF